jgi:hypothetical protein
MFGITDLNAGIPSCLRQLNQRYSTYLNTGSTRIKVESATSGLTLCHRWWIWPMSNLGGGSLPLTMPLGCSYRASWNDLEVQRHTISVVFIWRLHTRRGSADHSLWRGLSSSVSCGSAYEFQEGSCFSCSFFIKLVYRSRRLCSRCAFVIRYDKYILKRFW